MDIAKITFKESIAIQQLFLEILEGQKIITESMEHIGNVAKDYRVRDVALECQQSLGKSLEKERKWLRNLELIQKRKSSLLD